MGWPIGAMHVFELVDQGVMEVGMTPLRGIGGQHNRRPEEAAGHGCRELFVEKHGDGPADAGVAGQSLEQRLPFQPWQTATAHGPQPPQRRTQGQEESHHTRAPAG